MAAPAAFKAMGMAYVNTKGAHSGAAYGRHAQQCVRCGKWIPAGGLVVLRYLTKRKLPIARWEPGKDPRVATISKSPPMVRQVHPVRLVRFGTKWEAV